MKAFDSIQDLSLDSLNDVPPAPVGFNEYVERELHERTRTAYERGLDRGSKYRLATLLLGLILGWLMGFSLGIIS